jgi:hypothetical protein
MKISSRKIKINLTVTDTITATEVGNYLSLIQVMPEGFFRDVINLIR